MNEKALRAYELYVSLGEGRTLRRVRDQYAARGEKLPLPTLKRWSAKFGWQKHVQQHSDLVAQTVLRKLRHSEAAQRVDELSAIRELKRRFIRRAMIDPSDPNLSREDRQQAYSPSLKDFVLLLQLERQLASAEPEEETSRPVQPATRTLTYQDLAKRYGLPDPDRYGPKGSHSRDRQGEDGASDVNSD